MFNYLFGVHSHFGAEFCAAVVDHIDQDQEGLSGPLIYSWLVYNFVFSSG
jgi:hypothetical protein